MDDDPMCIGNSNLLKKRYRSVLVTALLAAHTVFAQPPHDITRSTSFTRYIPSSAGFYMSIRNPSELNKALHLSPFRQLLSIISGKMDDTGHSIDFRSAFESILGPHHSVDLDQLMKCEVGIVARSLSEFSNAVWFVRLPGGMKTDQWFPEVRPNRSGLPSSIRLFRSRNGLIVCAHDDIIALAGQPIKGSYIRRIYQMMRGGNESSLSRLRAYRELTAYLPARPVGSVYIALKSSTKTEGSTSPIWPVFDRAVVGMYEREDRLDFTIRGSTHNPLPTGRVTTDAMERLLDLPASTLFAMVAPLDMDLSLPSEPTSITSTFSRYVSFLMRYRNAQWAQVGPLPRLGPHIIMAWGQDLRLDGSTPELAVMIESEDPLRLREELTSIAKNLTDLFSRIPPEQGGIEIHLQREAHLGLPIHSMTLKAPMEDSANPWFTLLETLQPSWTSWRGWFIFALSRDHLERILDAQFGLVPTLTVNQDARTLRRQRPNRSHIAIMQPRLAVDVLDRWMKGLRNQESNNQPQWFSWWLNQNTARSERLGIGMKTQQEPGVVVVARVYPDTIASGSLQPEDRIIGVDGRLVSLKSPNADLRRLWSISKAQPGPTFRVIRSGKVLDIVLRQQRTIQSVVLPSISPANVLRDIISLGRTIPFATFVAFVSDERRYSARFSFRVMPPGPS